MGLFIAWLLWTPLAVLINGWMMSLFWAWFAVPMGAPKIGVAHAIGLGALVSLITHHVDLKDDGEPAWRLFVKGTLVFVLLRVVYFVVAWMAHVAMQ